ncbi:MAG: cytochrome b N-terminal domain-containing protein [Candidatus Hydrogenedentota bacterium]|nr:MAG: cytochrome b N-terminal domain-containing protein [Candidatus Hydrogenedentota bacterium]
MRPRKNSPREIPGLLQRISRSIFPDPLIPRTDSERKRYLVKNLILHFRPATVPEKTLRFTLTWGLGGMAAVLVLLQIGTGLLLKFAFEPTPVAAYASIQSLQNDVPFGQLIRNLHHWSAHLLVLIVFLHMLRVFFTGAFQPPRQFNWIIGWAMFGTVLTANFTGYLLPYDQLAYWAVTVSTGMLEYVPVIGSRLREVVRGGGDIGPATLRIFFAIHTALVPAALVLFMGFHFWRVRKSGGLVIPRGPDEGPVDDPVRVATLPNLLLREVVTALMLIAGVLLLSVFLNAPLEDPANPGLSPNPTKAPWYFAGLQELLLHLHPTFAVFVIPFLITIAVIMLPYMNYEVDTRGIWFASRTGRRMAVIACIIALVITPLVIVVDEGIVDANVFASVVQPVIWKGLVPTILLVAAIVGFYLIMKRRFSASNNEAIQAVFVLLIVAFVVLTITGVWFRGPGMKLVVPWHR